MIESVERNVTEATTFLNWDPKELREHDFCKFHQPNSCCISFPTPFIHQSGHTTSPEPSDSHSTEMHLLCTLSITMNTNINTNIPAKDILIRVDSWLLWNLCTETIYGKCNILRLCATLMRWKWNSTKYCTRKLRCNVVIPAVYKDSTSDIMLSNNITRTIVYADDRLIIWTINIFGAIQLLFT